MLTTPQPGFPTFQFENKEKKWFEMICFGEFESLEPKNKTQLAP